MTTTLEQFSRFSYIWSKDRDEELANFLKKDPLLLDFRAQIKRYGELAESIMELPEYYDVGPISLLSGRLTEIHVCLKELSCLTCMICVSTMMLNPSLFSLVGLLRYMCA